MTNSWASFAWNAAAQPVTVAGVSATYDALGRMVETASGTVYSEYVFAPSGAKAAIIQNGALIKGTVALPGGSTAIMNASGLGSIRHKDWLGSSRLATGWGHQIISKEAYAPFGETYDEAGTPDRSFTGQDQDTTSGIYDFMFRRYDSAAGRWLSPDPAGWNSVIKTSPQSLDRYAYVQNNPNSLIDPNGLSCITLTTQDGQSIPADDGDGLGCGAAGIGPGNANDGSIFQDPYSVTVYASDSNSSDLTTVAITASDANSLYSHPSTPPPGVCTTLEVAGLGTAALGAGVFIAGTILDGTVVGIVVGVPMQASGTMGMAVGTLGAGVGALGKAFGFCN